MKVHTVGEGLSLFCAVFLGVLLGLLMARFFGLI